MFDVNNETEILDDVLLLSTSVRLQHILVHCTQTVPPGSTVRKALRKL